MKVIFIDWYKTLSSSVFWQHLEDIKPNIYKKVVSAYLETHGSLINPWMRGEFTAEQICKKIADSAQEDYELVLDSLKQSAQDMKFDDPSILKLISQVRHTGIKIVIATDNMDTFNRWTVPSLQLNKHFDGILNSWKLKTLKGDSCSRFFGQYISNNHLSPDECVIIDDSEDKNNTIARYGIKYIQITSPSEVSDILKQFT